MKTSTNDIIVVPHEADNMKYEGYLIGSAELNGKPLLIRKESFTLYGHH